MRIFAGMPEFSFRIFFFTLSEPGAFRFPLWLLTPLFYSVFLGPPRLSEEPYPNWPWEMPPWPPLSSLSLLSRIDTPFPLYCFADTPALPLLPGWLEYFWCIVRPLEPVFWLTSVPELGTLPLNPLRADSWLFLPPALLLVPLLLPLLDCTFCPCLLYESFESDLWSNTKLLFWTYCPLLGPNGRLNDWLYWLLLPWEFWVTLVRLGAWTPLGWPMLWPLCWFWDRFCKWLWKSVVV